MGLYSSSRRSAGRYTKDNKNPDPERWHIIKSEQVGKVLLAEVLYPNATNFEGRKLLMFHWGVTLDRIVKDPKLDPHFRAGQRDTCGHVPVARFVPTEFGWQIARAAAKYLDALGA